MYHTSCAYGVGYSKARGWPVRVLVDRVSEATEVYRGEGGPEGV